MSTEVFNGLIQVICELYLDDLISYADSEEQCIDRLRQIFDRCRQKHLTLHHRKCKFGLSVVEYIEHTLDSSGIHFTRSRLDSILNFDLPRTQKRLKSFLGFANYFRDHVQDYATLAAPLHRVAETIRRLHANNIRWHGMNKDIESYVKLCPCCQKNDQHFNKNISIPFTVHGSRPFEKVDIDFIVGLLPDLEGITTIMVVIDLFSRWVNLYGLKEWSAEEAATSLVRHIGQYGSPKTITSDKDPVLLGQIVKQTLKLTGIKQIHTVAGSKQEQGIVERANKEVMRHLRNFIFDKSVIKSYSKYIPLVQRILNSSYHRITGFSPAQLLYGNAIDLFRNTILEENLLEVKDISYNTWVQELKSMQIHVLAIAQRNLTKHESIHLDNYPLIPTEFDVGSYVLVEYDNPFRRGPSTKLLPFLKNYK